MIRWVIFDIGGVVIDIAPHETYQRLSEIGGVTPEQVAALFKSSLDTTANAKSFYELAVVGRISQEEYLRSLLWELPNKVSREELIEAELLTLAGDKTETVALIEELKGKVGVGCYSNTHQVHWDHLLKERSWYQHLNPIFASHVQGFAKPDPEVFRFMQRELGATPSECVLIDDLEKNIRSAKGEGWNVIHFREISQVRSELDKLL